MRLEKRLTDLERKTGKDQPALIVIRSVIGGGYGQPNTVTGRQANIFGVGKIWQGSEELDNDFYARVHASQYIGELQPVRSRGDLDRLVSRVSKRVATELADTGSVANETYEALAGQISLTEANRRRDAKQRQSIPCG